MGSSRYDRPVSSVFGPQEATQQLSSRQQQHLTQQQQQQQQSPLQQQQQQQIQQQQQQPPQHPNLQQQQQQQHILFDLSPIDARDEVDEKVLRSYANLKQLIVNKSTKECQDAYNKFIAANPQNIEDLTMGLLVAILVEQDGQQSRYYSDIVMFSKDSLNLFSCYLNMIIIEKFTKLRDFSVKQIVWITNQLIRANFASSENICSNIMRQIAGGDLSPRNAWLTESVLELLIEHRNWVVNVTTFMGPTAIYTYMRLIFDHIDCPNLKELQQKEIDFVIGLLKENFLYSTQIGRDFMRLLHNIVKVPEFEKLWNDIYNDPKSLNQNFQGPLQIMTARTPRRLVQSRLTFDMERKINFLATQVKFGNHKRYQDWFHKQYLSTPESLSLRCDIIRYICFIIHPSNEVLCSDIIPRWALIGWLLTTCTTSVSSFNSKLTLFYDWLFYDTRTDSIMNIEPGILLMHYSRHSHPNVTQSSLDFLCRVSTTFLTKLAEHIKIGIKKSLQQILEKRVLPSIVHLFEFPKDSILRGMIKENFSEFCHPAGQTAPDNGAQSAHQTAANHTTPTHPSSAGQTVVNKHVNQPEISIDTEKTNALQNPTTANPEPPTKSNILTNQDQSPAVKINDPINKLTEKRDIISDKISCIPAQAREEAKAFTWNGNDHGGASYSHKQINDPKAKKSNNIENALDSSKKNKDSNSYNASNSFNKASKNTIKETFKPFEPNNTDQTSIEVIYPFMVVQNRTDMNEIINNFDQSLRSILDDLYNERDNETRCELMDKIISMVFIKNDNSIDQYSLSDLAQFIAQISEDDFRARIFPSDDQSHESLKISTSYPFFVLCRATVNNDNKIYEKSEIKPLSLLTEVMKFLDSTGFLFLYFLRVYMLLNVTLTYHHYIRFCTAAKRNFSKCLEDDLRMVLTYDSEMFCFLLPLIFGELSVSGSFQIIGNVDLLHMVVANIDAVHLQELLCLCMTGNAKVLTKEILPVLGASLDWESWEQYALWKLVAAHNVPLGNYISILPKLDSKVHPEALSCILLALQKETVPSMNMVHHILNCECKNDDPFSSSILRFWSMKTDVNELARNIASLFDSTSSTKRKSQAKSLAKPNLSTQNERILLHLESIRRRAPKNRLLVHQEILDVISQMEPLCNDGQRKKFADLFSHRPRSQTKKQKKNE